MDIKKAFSGLFTLDVKDAINGTVMAFIGAFLGSLNDVFSPSKVMAMNWATFRPIVYCGITAAISYLIKRFISNSKGEVLTPEATPKEPKIDINQDISSLNPK